MLEHRESRESTLFQKGKFVPQNEKIKRKHWHHIIYPSGFELLNYFPASFSKKGKLLA